MNKLYGLRRLFWLDTARRTHSCEYLVSVWESELGYRDASKLQALEKDPSTLVGLTSSWSYIPAAGAELVDKLHTDATIMFFAACALRPSFLQPGQEGPFLQMWDRSRTITNPRAKALIVSNSTATHLALAARVWVAIAAKLAAGETVGDAVTEVNGDSSLFVDPDGNMFPERWEVVGDPSIRIAPARK
jgi:hypothetical protein